MESKADRELREAQERLEAAKAKLEEQNRRIRQNRLSAAIGVVLGTLVGLGLAFGGQKEVRWQDLCVAGASGIAFLVCVYVIARILIWIVKYRDDNDDGGPHGVDWRRLSMWYMRGRLRSSMRKMSR